MGKNFACGKWRVNISYTIIVYLIPDGHVTYYGRFMQSPFAFAYGSCLFSTWRNKELYPRAAVYLFSMLMVRKYRKNRERERERESNS
jgi:hypothetical protein